MKDAVAEIPDELALTETEWRLIQWLRVRTGGTYVELLTPTQRKRFDAFVRSMSESPTVH